MSWHTPSTDLGTHICIKLINLVKQHPVIYLSSKEFAPYPRKNRNEINQIWENIADDIGLSVEDCKRRWKGLKDVYAKIRKRRLQEGVLGINARKKWLYEEVMSFMKFPFEKPYQKALENFEEVDCNEWRMEDAESNDTSQDVLNDISDHLALPDSKFKDHITKTDEQEEQIQDVTIEYLDLDLEVDSVPDSEGYESTHILEKEENSESKRHAQVSIQEEKNTEINGKIQLGSRYRAIRPKPYQPNLLSENLSIGNSDVKKKANSRCTPVLNVSNLDPLNQIIVSSSMLKRWKKCDTVMPAGSNIEVKNNGKESSDGVSSTSPTTMKLDSFQNMKVNISVDSKKIESPFRMSTKNSSVSSVELFFQSMAQTVMNLPTRAQAEIKMEICKVVTRAEIQYSLSQSTTKLESHKFKSKKG